MEGIWIAGLALFISAVSAYYSREAIRLSKSANDKASCVLIEDSKCNLLERLSDNRTLLHRTWIEIGALEADFSVESDCVKKSMQNFTLLFSESMPLLEARVNEIDGLIGQVMNWADKISYEDIARFKAEQHLKLNDYKISNEGFLSCVSDFREKIPEARGMCETL